MSNAQISRKDKQNETALKFTSIKKTLFLFQAILMLQCYVFKWRTVSK